MNGKVVNESFKGWRLTIYLPPAYGIEKGKYPVVYVQDGDDLFAPDKCRSLAKIECMFTEGTLGQLLLIGIEPKNRHDDYTPWRAPAPSKYSADFGGKGRQYLSFLAEELKPFIDQKYRTDPRSQKTGMIGASLGGLISLYGVYLYPDVIGKTGSISGSLWYENFIRFMCARRMKTENLKIYMAVGDREGAGKQNIKGTMVEKTKEAYGILKASGIEKAKLRLVIEEGGGHGHDFFCRRFPEAIKWLFAD